VVRGTTYIAGTGSGRLNALSRHVAASAAVETPARLLGQRNDQPGTKKTNGTTENEQLT
jgi:hypothetical protein